MEKTPNNLQPRRRPVALDPAAAKQAPTAQMPHQAPQSIPLTPDVEQPAPVAAAATEDAPSMDELAAIMARRRNMPQAGDLQMAVPQRVGWARRWVNDLPGRVNRFLKKGWDFVKNPETGENWLLVVNKQISQSGGLRGYVMQIPLQFYAEDQEAKQESLDATDAAIYGGHYDEEPDDKRYVPKSTPIEVRHVTGPGQG